MVNQELESILQSLADKYAVNISCEQIVLDSRIVRRKGSVFVAAASDRVWYSGPPPHIGWWNASTSLQAGMWRWFDGKHWSVPFSMLDTPTDKDVRPAIQLGDKSAVIYWSDYWPENAVCERSPYVKERLLLRPTNKELRLASYFLVFPDGKISPHWGYSSIAELKNNAPGEVTGEVSSWEHIASKGYRYVKADIVRRDKPRK